MGGPRDHSGRRRGILVVDDEPIVRMAVARLLESRYRVAVAAGAREALGLIASAGSFDLILCDLVMPDIDGMGFLACLARQAPALAERTVFMTAGGYTAAHRAFLAARPGRWLSKPFEPDALASFVEGALERAGGAGNG
jgi:two-component system NtrC family sensor kinase